MITNRNLVGTLTSYMAFLAAFAVPGVLMSPCSAGAPPVGTVQSVALASLAADPAASTTVDDFETYTNTSPNKIYETWIDGLGYAGRAGNGSGALAGHDILGRGTRYTTIAETVLVHGGKQSMPLYFYDVKTPFYSEVERTFAGPQDWTTGGGITLSLWFRGQASNAADPLYVNVEDNAGKNKTVVHTDAQAAKAEQWQPWQIDLAGFSGAGVNLKSVTKLRLGVGDRSKTKAGGLGLVYFDDVAISRGAAPAPSKPSVGTKSQGSIVCWGSNVYGQCKGVPAGSDFVAIAAGAYYTLALRADGSIVGWGKNEHGQATPPAGNDFVAIAAGNYHSLAIKADGTIVGWGGNDYGESTPPEGNDFIAIAAGDSYSLALRSDHSMIGWGYNNKGQAMTMPGKNYTAIAAGRVQSAALKDNGTIVVWGTTGWSYTGGGLYVFFGRSPDTTDFIALGVGNTHGVGLRADGSVEAWGYVNGIPPTTKGFTALAVGGEHDLALNADGSIFGWSRNDYGQATPPAGKGFFAISAGREHSVAIKGE